MTRPAAHWRRPLRSGGVEFYFRSTAGDVLQGSLGADPALDVGYLQTVFESATGGDLPAFELRPMRGPERRDLDSKAAQ